MLRTLPPKLITREKQSRIQVRQILHTAAIGDAGVTVLTVDCQRYQQFGKRKRAPVRKTEMAEMIIFRPVMKTRKKCQDCATAHAEENS